MNTNMNEMCDSVKSSGRILTHHYIFLFLLFDYGESWFNELPYNMYQ